MNVLAKPQRDALPDDAPHLLIVDDDHKIRDLLARYLFEQGFRVTTAEHAAAARAAMRGLSFDIILLDVMMPGESGLDFARELKATTRVPICMLTARAEADQRIEEAFAKSGPDAETATRRFLLAMIAEPDQPWIEALIGISDDGTLKSSE